MAEPKIPPTIWGIPVVESDVVRPDEIILVTGHTVIRQDAILEMEDGRWVVKIVGLPYEEVVRNV